MKKTTPCLLAVVALTACSSQSQIGLPQRRASAMVDDGYRYLNDLAGAYSIYSTSVGLENKVFDICGGYMSATGDDAPYIILYDSAPIAQANHRFSFMPVGLEDGKMTYEISSVVDKEGRLDPLNSSVSEYSPITFATRNNNASQRWYARSNDGGSTIELVSYANPSLVVGTANGEKDGFPYICLTSAEDSPETKWKIASVAGDYGLNSKTYIVEDNTGYASRSVEASRYLSPLDDNASSRISGIVSVGVHGDRISKTTYGDVPAFSVPYDSEFYVDTSFNYANSIYAAWQCGLPLGKRANSGGSVMNWYLGNDSYTFTTLDSEEKAVGTGAILIETSSDNVNWDRRAFYSFNSEKASDTWSLDGALISNGVYIRVSYLFEIYCVWTTFEREWYNYLLFGIPIGGHDEEHREYKNIIEVSDTFFVGVDGFSEAEDFGVIQIENLSSEKEENEIDVEGFSKKEVAKAKTLTNGDMTTTGFTVNSLYPENAYRLEISKNDGGYAQISSGYTTSQSGKYTIRATSRFGNQKCIDVYVCSDDLVESYFGTSFANKPDECALVEGKRLFAGKNDYLASLGVNPTYGWANLPVYEKGCEIHINDTRFLSSLSGKIQCQGLDGEEEMIIAPQNEAVRIPLEKPGLYQVELRTSGNYGDIVFFGASFWVVDEAIGPEINKQVFESVFKQSYDLLPVYYSVDMPRGPYTYLGENGERVEKQGVLRYAFSSYEAAFDFSLRVQKQYAYRIEKDLFRYLNSANPNMLLGEYELFQEMSRVAKNNVKLNYFSHSNQFSMVGTNTKGIISEQGFVYYLAEESFDGSASNAAPIVACSKSERDALLSRKRLLNDFVFVRMPLDSEEIKLISEDGQEYLLSYDVPVEEQLSPLGARSGLYEVVENTIFGETTTYKGYYIDRSAACDISVSIRVGDQIISLGAVEDGALVNCKGGFAFERACDPYDEHGLLLLEKDRVESPFDIASLPAEPFVEEGTYHIRVEDRLGRYFDFTIIVS